MINKFFFGVAFFIFLISSCETAFETDLTIKKVQLLSPSDSLISTDTGQIFYWDEIVGAVNYQLQIVSPNFATIDRLIEDTTIERNRFSKDLQQGFYQWRVRAINNGSHTEYSQIWNLEIE